MNALVQQAEVAALLRERRGHVELIALHLGRLRVLSGRLRAPRPELSTAAQAAFEEELAKQNSALADAVIDAAQGAEERPPLSQTTT